MPTKTNPGRGRGRQLRTGGHGDTVKSDRPHEAVVMTVADGMACPRKTTIEDSDPRAFAFELAKEIEAQIRAVACDQPVETKVVLHIVKD